ncbi:LysR family transcriptional regulator [Roseovarius aquimarinus]|uniref:LysR family transcriptional regulator n=1 Tax=Roseovarius aquimarinus TaxID=1229156 RepID=UPI00366F033B
MRAFEAAARFESFAKAAEELKVSHTVISRHVRNLERWLETELFQRDGNRVRLTPAGRMISPKITGAMVAIDDAFQSIGSGETRQTVHVVAEPAFASLWLRRHLDDFRARYPRFELDLKASWSPPTAERSGIDVVIHFDTRFPQGDETATRLFPIDAFPAAAPRFLEDHPAPGGEYDMAHVPLVHDHGVSVWRGWFEEHEASSNNWKSGRVYSDLSLAIDAATDGEGVILADDILCERELATGVLVQLDKRKTRCAWYSAHFIDESRSNAACRAFKSWLMEATQDLRPA